MDAPLPRQLDLFQLCSFLHNSKSKNIYNSDDMPIQNRQYHTNLPSQAAFTTDLFAYLHSVKTVVMLILSGSMLRSQYQLSMNF